MSTGQQLFFIAIVPPPPLSETVRAMQEEFALAFNCRKALDVLPHLTIKPPFRVAVDDAKLLSDCLDVMNFSIELNGFAAFKNKKHPVIYVKILPNTNLLDLHERLAKSFRLAFPSLSLEKERAFAPHLTIAYRDLTKPMFDAAWPEYRERVFEASFQAEQLHLLKHNGGHWEIIGSSAI